MSKRFFPGHWCDVRFDGTAAHTLDVVNALGWTHLSPHQAQNVAVA